MFNREVVLAALIEDFLEEEAKRQCVPIDAPVVAATLVEEVQEMVEQSAYEAINFLVDARDSLPDVPTMEELRGRCR